MKSLAFALLPFFLVCGAARADDSTMRATLVEGMVTMAPAGGAGQGPLQEGDPLREGDTVVTQPGARLEITFSSGTVLRVGESSRMTLGESVPQKAFSAKIFLGNVWARVHKLLAAETFHLETENGVAGVRGTEFRIEVEPGKEDLLRVYEGAVQVDGKGGKWSHRVEASHELRFHKDREPMAPSKFDASTEKKHKFMEWVRERKEHRAPEHEKRERKHRH